ncbi:MAG: RidA family protein [Pseudomonadota bacterium]
MTVKRFDPVPTQYSKAVVHGDTVYLAGLIAENWDKDITGQTNEIFKQIDDLLAEAGTDKSNILSFTVYVATFDDYAAFKEAYAAWIDPDNLPARATVRADLLDPKLKIEIQTIAAIR